MKEQEENTLVTKWILYYTEPHQLVELCNAIRKNMPTCSSARTRIHAHLQLLVIEWIEDGVGDDIPELPDLRLTRPSRTRLERFICIIRGVFMQICVMVGAIAMVLALPLGILHTPLLLLGFNPRYLPLDVVQRAMGFVPLVCSGISVFVENEADFDPKARIIAFTHASSMDGFVVSAGIPISIKMVGKRSIYAIPILGWALKAYGNISVDREHPELAVQALSQAAKDSEVTHRGIAISPEGTRSLTGLIAPFKKGPFHLALQTGSAITPVLISGAFDALEPGIPYSYAGEQTVRILPPVPLNGDHNTLRKTLQRVMLEELRAGKPFKSRRQVSLLEFYLVAVPMIVCVSVPLISLSIMYLQ